MSKKRCINVQKEMLESEVISVNKHTLSSVMQYTVKVQSCALGTEQTLEKLNNYYWMLHGLILGTFYLCFSQNDKLFFYVS